MIVVFAVLIFNFTQRHLHTEKCQVERYEPSNSVALKQGIALFNKVGIDIGDSVDLLFTNGYCANDIPIYTGEYANAGGQVIIAYPGEDYLEFKISHENNLWDVANLKDSDLASITLSKKYKYKDVNDIFSSNKSYSDNFRSLNCGTIKKDSFFRGSNNAINYDLQSLGINYVVDVSGYSNGDNVDGLGLNSINIKSKDCNSKVISSLLKLSKYHTSDKTLIYCENACNTDAYYIAILEGLAGFSYDEIAEDYMLSIYECYGVDSFSEQQFNNLKKFTIDGFLHMITKSDENYDMSQCDMKYCTERYLRNCGVSTPDIELIRNRINS